MWEAGLGSRHELPSGGSVTSKVLPQADFCPGNGIIRGLSHPSQGARGCVHYRKDWEYCG
jgi:hypothetical protein